MVVGRVMRMRRNKGITLAELERQLREAEKPFGMSSDAIAAAAARGDIEETPEFLEWSLLYTAWQQTSAAEEEEGLIEA